MARPGEIVDWSTVQVGDIVYGKDSQPWVVTERDGTQYTVEREGRKPFVGNFTGSVRIVETAAQVMDTAVATIIDTLGGGVLDAEMDGVLLCPVEYDEPGTLMAHLYRLHGVRFDPERPESPMSVLNSGHNELHDVRLPEQSGYVRHHHDP